MRAPRAFVEQSAFDIAVRKAEQKLRHARHVVQLRHALDYDMDGLPVVWFRVVLPDTLVTKEKLLDATNYVAYALERELQPQGRWDVYPHYRFRSKTEHDAIHEPAWA